MATMFKDTRVYKYIITFHIRIFMVTKLSTGLAVHLQVLL